MLARPILNPLRVTSCVSRIQAWCFAFSASTLFLSTFSISFFSDRCSMRCFASCSGLCSRSLVSITLFSALL
ncbi:Os09g0542550 [Oryza sativa Japonica Group]|uniref:Os09g0542550 protein n=1 Tax=Oryza sativa subsp. japonica TaxID=39947 RepID=A0A0P0XPU8_ORYSJ|nr:hypothetical protein EE612_049248 [Oryza sativa]BAT09215.1 Os09g0542550 [Oryza sativa Japonica Group]